MPLIRVIQGQQVQANAAFRHPDGSTIVGTGEPAIWAVRDFNNNLVANGAGTQSHSDPELWTAQFVIPTTAPIADNGERYQIIWEFPLSTGSISAIERFEVLPENDPQGQGQQTDILVIQGKGFTDSLQVPAEVETDSLKYEIRDLSNNLLLQEISVGATADRIINSMHHYDFESPDEIPGLTTGGQQSLNPYLGIWEYKLPGEPTSYEFHGIYVANLQAIALIQKMRQIVDRANLQDIHPFLTFNDLDLLHYLYRGLEFINSFPPSLTSWTPETMPATAVDLVVKAGAMHALQGQYLAEGMATFDFQGLGVQLSTDRTQYIQSVYDQLQQDLQERIPRFKRLLIRSSSPGALTVSISPLTSFTLNIDTSFYNRNDLYRAVPFTIFGF